MKVSFLLGSGFSIPAGYPSTQTMNNRLAKIDASEICVHTSRYAWFLNGAVDPNASWMGVEERRFVQQFLEFYNAEVLQDGATFNYEDFYDYYIGAYREERYPDNLRNFLKKSAEHRSPFRDSHNVLMEFNDIFSQLVAHLLNHRLEPIHYVRPYGRPYGAFLTLLDSLSTDCEVHIHSLNHDLFLESLSASDAIQGHLADGFDVNGSPAHSTRYDNHTRHTVRLRRFADKFDERFNLYKLHGSIDQYWAAIDDGSCLVKVPWGFSADEIHIEVATEGKLEYKHSPADVVPDFLSGRTYKVGRYEKGNYYPLVMKRFKQNLIDSRTLIVIGYGFADKEINRHLEEDFLRDRSNTMCVVDISRPKTHMLEYDNVRFIPGGVSDMDLDVVLRVAGSE